MGGEESMTYVGLHRGKGDRRPNPMKECGKMIGIFGR